MSFAQYIQPFTVSKFCSQNSQMYNLACSPVWKRADDMRIKHYPLRGLILTLPL